MRFVEEACGSWAAGRVPPRDVQGNPPPPPSKSGWLVEDIPNPYRDFPRPKRGPVMPKDRGGPPNEKPPASIKTVVFWWSFFWALWFVPGIFPLMGMPGVGVLELLGVKRYDWGTAMMITFYTPIWGWIPMAATTAVYKVMEKSGKREKLPPFSITYATVVVVVFGLYFLSIHLSYS